MTYSANGARQQGRHDLPAKPGENSSWEERKQKGQEAVYQASFQANRYFQKWNKGLEAADRCVSLLRTGAAGAWSDAQEPDAVPGPPGAAMELPDWDPGPPGP